jgi:hypothetical protein
LISDILDTLRGFIGKRVRICFYVGEGSGMQQYHEAGYLQEVNEHKLVFKPDPTVEGDWPIVMTTLLTEFVAIYSIDELDPDKPIKTGEKHDS